MIASLAEIKSILGYSDASKDSQIAALLLPQQQRVSDYCKNRFLRKDLYVSSNMIEFRAGSDPDYDTIIDPDEDFLDAYFHDNMDLYISGSVNNDGFHHVTTTAAGVLTLDSREQIIDEGPTITGLSQLVIYLYKVQFPISLKIPFARLIEHELQPKGRFESSESLPGGYSVTYKNNSDLMLELFGSFRKPYL